MDHQIQLRCSLKAVVFETGHFSVYGVGYKNPAPAFTDITGHWAADNILFAASRGLLSAPATPPLARTPA